VSPADPALFRGSIWSFALIAALLFSFPGSAFAQSLADRFGGFSKKNNAPINIEADSLEVLDDKKFAIFKGNVKVRQGKFQLISKKLKVTYTGNIGGQNTKKKTQGIKHIDASGKVAISTPDNQSATSDWAKFDVLAKIVTIGGNVVLSQGGNVMRGDKLVIDLNTGRSKFHSTTKPSNGKKGKRPRISGVFLPGKTNGKNPFGAMTRKKTVLKKKTVETILKKKTQTDNPPPPLPWQKQPVTGN
jgi:lipopolysaccharide export system protein LptA